MLYCLKCLFSNELQVLMTRLQIWGYFPSPPLSQVAGIHREFYQSHFQCLISYDTSITILYCIEFEFNTFLSLEVTDDYTIDCRVVAHVVVAVNRLTRLLLF